MLIYLVLAVLGLVAGPGFLCCGEQRPLSKAHRLPCSGVSGRGALAQGASVTAAHGLESAGSAVVVPGDLRRAGSSWTRD